MLSVEKESSEIAFSTLNEESRRVIEEFSGYIKFDYPVNDLEDIYPSFLKSTDTLSSLLPKVSDSSLLEIDDLLYPNESEFERLATNVQGENSTNILIQKCFKNYLLMCKFSLTDEDFRGNRLMHTLILQLLEHSSKEDFRIVSKLTLDYIWMLTNESKSATAVAFALKMLRVASTKHHDVIIRKLKYCTPIGIYDLVWLCNLKDIPEAKDSDRKRITTWISQQAAIISERFNIQEIKLSKISRKYINAYESLNEENLDKFMNVFARVVSSNIFDPFVPSSVIGNHLYKYFMSANDESQKLKRLEYFVKAFCQTDINKTTSKMVNLFIKNVIKIIRKYLIFWYKFLDVDRNRLKQLEKQQCFEPYILKNDETSGQKKNEITEDSTIGAGVKETVEELDCTIEKFLFHDDYLRGQHVITILYTACRKFADIVELNDIEKEEIELKEYRFRQFTFINNFISMMFRHLKSKPVDSYIPWWFDNHVRKCPFFFVSRHHEHLLEDLIRIVHGQNVNLITREHCYFATIRR